MPSTGGFECNGCSRARALAEVTADCGATLIVCPTPILQQWREEIAKHLHEGANQPACVLKYTSSGSPNTLSVHLAAACSILLQIIEDTASAPRNRWTCTAAAGAMRIVVYEGQAQRRAGKTAAVVTATELAAADVVLTTYEVLRRDIHQQPSPGDSGDYRMRNRKKYEVGTAHVESFPLHLTVLGISAAGQPVHLVVVFE